MVEKDQHSHDNDSLQSLSDIASDPTAFLGAIEDGSIREEGQARSEAADTADHAQYRLTLLQRFQALQPLMQDGNPSEEVKMEFQEVVDEIRAAAKDHVNQNTQDESFKTPYTHGGHGE